MIFAFSTDKATGQMVMQCIAEDLDDVGTLVHFHPWLRDTVYNQALWAPMSIYGEEDLR